MLLSSQCAWCGKTTSYLGRGRPKRFCCRPHRQRHYEWSCRSSSSVITLSLIAERDGYRCGICTGPVDMDASGEEGPSIDHVVPMSKGGTSTAINLQLAHLSCNVLKGDRVAFSRPPIGSESQRPLTLWDPPQ